MNNKYPIPLTADLFDRLGGVIVFTKIYLKTGYWQVRIAKADEHKTALPLTKLLKKVTPWDWGPRQAEAFNALKAAMSSSLVLAFSDLAKPFKVQIDTSDYVLGGVLLQVWNPVAYESRKLKDTE
ncbi:PREDICTED: protein NYNRIN-like [Nicotiana attenuata]|uniref:protein NYNRIN-like n=1 Tax=Nicotiana attenuata TaxID=49451 RepID=UPI000904F78A|nr:PREDICTED: protein NYNRIN-like [Nicotiana attenuata]